MQHLRKNMQKWIIRYLWGVQLTLKVLTFSLKGDGTMDSKKIGSFIAKNRKKKGLTQEQLGERLGVTNKTISRWENGNYMPDLSLLEPLSKELGITINELLAGEFIEEEKTVEYLEQNLLSTIVYTDNKIKNEQKKISCFIIGIGILICICSFTIFPSESSWSEIYSIAGLLVMAIGIYRELPLSSRWKRGLISSGIFILIAGIFFVIDYIGVTQFERPPIYRYKTTTVFDDMGNKLIEYQNLFYNVYRINADTVNEYYLIDRKKQYDIDTVPVSPFNQNISAIEHILQYENKYIGDNSNIGRLIGALPLSEYGYVYEIDSKNCGLIIDYHFTDWYDNEDLYTERALIYNSVSAFVLIENLESITFNFSGSSYIVTRDSIEKNYPNYTEIFTDGSISTKNFRKYVEEKIKDPTFVSNAMKIFEKRESQDLE